MDRLRFGHERPTDSDCCLICTCLSVRNFENAINTSVNSFNCVIVKCLVVHGLGDISCVCLACLVSQNLKQSATTPVLHWKKKIQCGLCTCLSVRNFENAINNSYNHIVSSSSSVEQESSPTVLSSAGLDLTLGLVTHTQNFINFSIIRNISNSGVTYQILGGIWEALLIYFKL
jgi:hypothetical protein